MIWLADWLDGFVCVVSVLLALPFPIAQALSHRYFHEHPLPCEPALMPTFPSFGAERSRCVNKQSQTKPAGRSEAGASIYCRHLN